MVAVCRNNAVAIECDGERWHSGDIKIREDMERQTILERLGWRFIRIRGSEYYRAPEQTIQRVVQELASYGIEPETSTPSTVSDRNTELLSRVKNCAAAILAKNKGSFGDNATVIEQALNPKVIEQLQLPNTKSHPGKSGPIALQNTVEQQVIPGMEAQAQTGDILTLLRQHGVRFMDKRGNGGALWLIGGNELKPIIAEAKRLGFAFHFKEDGGKATKGAPGWWGK